MPDSCCAFGCQNKGMKCSTLSFYRTPFGTVPYRTVPRLVPTRKAWVTAIKREKPTEQQIDNAKICGDHFITGKRSVDPNHPIYVPSLFPFPKKKKLQESNHYKDINEIFHVINTKLLPQNLSPSPWHRAT